MRKIGIFIPLFIVLGFLLVAPVLVSADHNTAHTVQHLQEQIKELQAKINALRPAQSTVQPATSGVTGAGVATVAQPARSISATMPVFDEDASDDDIIQLNNLRIQEIFGNTFPVIISASYDYGVRCNKFMNLDAPTGAEFPCPLAPDVLYRIRVDEDTRLLLRNRVRAHISDFEAGDRINVYGFMDRDTFNVDALIVRNLDKPQVKRFIQLNNVEAVSPPSSPTFPATLTVVQKNLYPCLDFGEEGTARGVPFPCPLGLEVTAEKPAVSVAPSGGGGSAASGVASIYPPYRFKKYIIEVTSRTEIFKQDRTPMALADIAVGDTLNVYGFQKVNGATIEALIIRDLSKPAKKETGTLRVTVTDASAICPMAMPSRESRYDLPLMISCGIIYNASVALYDGNGSFIGKQLTEKGLAVFENLREGSYTIIANALGYSEAKTGGINVKAGETTSVAVPLKKIGEKISVSTRSDLNGAVGKSFQATFYAEGGVPSYSFAVSSGSLPPGLELVRSPLPMAQCAIVPSFPERTICPEYKETSIWLQGAPTQAGTYTFELTAKDQQGASGSASFTAVISPQCSLLVDCAAPPINCRYEGGNTCACGKLVCETPAQPSSATGGY